MAYTINTEGGYHLPPQTEAPAVASQAPTMAIKVQTEQEEATAAVEDLRGSVSAPQQKDEPEHDGAKNIRYFRYSAKDEETVCSYGAVSDQDHMENGGY